MTDSMAIIITIVMVIVAIGLYKIEQGWGWILPLAWLVFYLYNEHLTATEWPK
jgi:hypothetical protein